MGALAWLKVAEGVIEFAPHLEDEATVEVVGQPGATKKQLYFLALSAAFALAKRIDPSLLGRYILPPPGMLMIEYDAADHWVRVTLRYKTSLLAAAAANLAAGVLGAIGAGGILTKVDFAALPVYSGPKCDVIGGTFDFVAGVPEDIAALARLAGGGGAADLLNIATAGIPSSSTTSYAPTLPFANKTILTTCAKVKDPNPALPGAGGAEIDSPNPKPPGDNRSRGAVVTGGASRPQLSILGGISAILTGNTGGTDPCCLDKSMSLVPLIFSALTDPGSYTREVFREPVGGPTGD